MSYLPSCKRLHNYALVKDKAVELFIDLWNGSRTVVLLVYLYICKFDLHILLSFQLLQNSLLFYSYALISLVFLSFIAGFNRARGDNCSLESSYSLASNLWFVDLFFPLFLRRDGFHRGIKWHLELWWGIVYICLVYIYDFWKSSSLNLIYGQNIWLANIIVKNEKNDENKVIIITIKHHHHCFLFQKRKGSSLYFACII